MSFLRDFVGSFRKKDVSDYPFNVVVEVKNDDYKIHHVYQREDCLVLYGSPDSSRFEIVLQKAMPSKGIEVDYSLCRFQNQGEADKVFHAMVKNQLPNLCNNFPDLVNAYSLQELVNYVRSNPEQTLAHICAYFGYLDCLKGIIASQPSLKDAVDPITQYTPLHLAVKGCRLPVIQYLVSCGADLSKTDARGWNIFHFAATTTREIISALLTSTIASSLSTSLSSGSNATLQSQGSLSSSSEDSTSSQSDHRMLIIKLINARSNDTNSPLYLACAADKPECIKELLKNGADVNGASLETIDVEKSSEHSLCNVIEQLDPKVMKMGGTALHWAKSPQCMEALIEMGCNINAKNFQGETVFHCTVAKKNLACIVTLLSHGADVNATGPNGETPLHIAVRTGDVTIVQALVVFGADLNTCNNSGETPRHIIATNKRISNQELILYILDTVGAKRCRKAHNLSCTDGCAINATFNGIPPETSPLSRIVSIHDVHYRDVLEEAVKRKKKKEMQINFDDPPENEIKLLCLDGGGIKGLILVQMLAILEDMTKRRTYDTFNWIAGTSTGGLLAISLALGNTAAQCRQLYFRLKDKVFLGPRPYDSEPLEKFVQKEFGVDTKISDIANPRLMITATKSDTFPAELFLFRNYPSANEIIMSTEPDSSRPPTPAGSDTLLWMAARSSGAAPTYFRPCGPYLDGGLISNNPTLDALTEISQINASYAHIGHPERTLKPTVVVSCGTGAIPTKSISILDVHRPATLVGVAKMAFMAPALGELLVDQATQSNGQVVERAKAWCHGIHLPFFRLNPPISENINLDETNNVKLINMLWETTVYMYNRKDELQELIYLLS
uniref:phospholipase A2 n=1 Tax=Tetranychus urticae TaxID=32264 RepID=T1JT22_TETUR